ncbi:MAG: 3-dehydroquinate synthase, partial [Candidatus Omnitrophica bacterium]|nr:3-dehydroquinate synthase [Candidatus Omnitrophota bacterium]
AYLSKKYGVVLIDALKKAGISVKVRIIPDSEKAKSLAQAWSLLEDIAVFSKCRRVFIVAFGGGVAGDLAGFVASVFRRGIPYIQVPTTLLAQVDSSIGGKTAVDLETGKNMVGAFYQPRLVVSDTNFLKSLSARDRRSGLAEVIKYGVIKDRRLFSFLEGNLREVLELKDKALIFIVTRSSGIKAEIVSRDEKEDMGLRTILNFGHTIGHAIEAAGKFMRYNHGEAISLGMLVAADISLDLKLIKLSDFTRIQKLFKKSGLPVEIKGLKLNDIIKAHYHDKKFVGARNRFVLLEGIGKARLQDNVPEEIVRRAVERRM